MEKTMLSRYTTLEVDRERCIGENTLATFTWSLFLSFRLMNQNIIFTWTLNKVIVLVTLNKISSFGISILHKYTELPPFCLVFSKSWLNIYLFRVLIRRRQAHEAFCNDAYHAFVFCRPNLGQYFGFFGCPARMTCIFSNKSVYVRKYI